MDLSMDIPLRSLARCASPRWQALFGSKEKVAAFLERSKELNKNLMTRPNALWKRRTAVWDSDMMESHGTHMVPVLVRTTI